MIVSLLRFVEEVNQLVVRKGTNRATRRRLERKPVKRLKKRKPPLDTHPDSGGEEGENVA